MNRVHAAEVFCENVRCLQVSGKVADMLSDLVRESKKSVKDKSDESANG